MHDAILKRMAEAVVKYLKRKSLTIHHKVTIRTN